jgi:hypothetical protein
MKVVALRASALFSVLLLAAPTWAAQKQRGPSTEEERQKALAIIDALEANPWAPEAEEARIALVRWLTEVPDFVVDICLSTLGEAKVVEKLPKELALQQLLSQAGFQLRHPELDRKSTQVFVAGVEGALRAYRVSRASGAVAKVEAFEELEQARAEGALEALVAERVRNCRES